MPEHIIGGTYRIEKVIGEGGGGIVYKAYHERLRKYVVLKQIIAGSFASMSMRNEVDLLKSLKHTYLPQVIDFIEDDGKVYTVMDFIEGSDLAAYSTGKKLDANEIIRISEQLLEAVSYLHSQNRPVIHSDIKPENIMITPEGNICLIDFNISLLFENMSDAYFGTRGYAAPEQIGFFKDKSAKTAQNAKKESDERSRSDSGTGTEYYSEGSGTEYYSENTGAELYSEGSGTEYYSESSGTEYYSEADNNFPENPGTSDGAPGKTVVNKRVTTLSDIYSVGAVMYYMISGKTPALDYNIIPLKKFRRGLPEGLTIIAEKAMSFKPSDRYKSSEEMLNAVRNVMKLDRRYKAIRVRRIIVSLICLAGMGASAFTAYNGLRTISAENEESYYSYILDADKSIEDGDYENAVLTIEKARAFMPEKPDSYYEELKLLYERGDYLGCINSYNINERLLSSANSNLSANIFFLLANAYFETEDYNNAARNYERSLSFNADKTECYRDLAISYARMGETDRAKDILNAATGVTDDQLYLVRSEIELNSENYDEAMMYAEKAAGVSDDGYILFRALKLISDIGNEADKHSRATELLEKYHSNASAAYSDYVSEMLANHYTYIGNETGDDEYYRKAINVYQKLMTNSSLKYVICKNCYELQNKLGEYNDCLETLRLMSETFDNDRWVMMSYSYTLINIQQALDNSERSYIEAYSYFIKANNLYADELKNGKSDPSMDMLSHTFEQLRAGGWTLE